MMATAELLEGTKVLMVLAHCDDELVCGWPILQDPAIHKQLLIVSSDEDNQERRWCGHRRHVTMDLCKLLGIEARVLSHDSDFYRLDHRSGQLANLEEGVLKAIDGFSFDYLFTHNPHGEYGHSDHKLLSSLLLRATRSPLIISDIHYRADWTRVDPVSPLYAETFYRNRIATVDIDQGFYRKVMRYYETRGAWTWSQDPVNTANLYRL